MHLHEIQRLSVDNLQQNGLVTLSVLSASVFLKTRIICACQWVEVFPQPRNSGCELLSLPGAAWAAGHGDVFLLAALPLEQQLCQGFLSTLLCCVLPVCTNHRSKWELAVALSVMVCKALMKGAHLGTFLILMSHMRNQALLFISY